MTVDRYALLQDTCSLLNCGAYKDSAPNGLQVEGKPTITCVVSGVTASKPLITKAIALKADAILVHHGYFWRGDDPCIVGPFRQKLAMLVEHNINLIAYHLPLDDHAILGNNAQLAKLMNWSMVGSCHGAPLSRYGQLEKPSKVIQLCHVLEQKLAHKPHLVVGNPNKIIQNVAWCTGAAGNLIPQASQAGADVYVTGEVSERHVHLAKEWNIVLIAAGHHATERYGVMALGKHWAKQYNINHQFVEIYSPV